MKLLINLLFLLLTLSAFSQECCVDLRVISNDQNLTDTLNYRFARKLNKWRATARKGNLSETLIVDSTSRKVIQLISGSAMKEAYIHKFKSRNAEDLDFGVTHVFEVLRRGIWEKDEYRLLKESKTICGVECIKIEVLHDGKVLGFGWIAPGIAFGMCPDRGFYQTPEGMIIEMELLYEDGGLRIICDKIDFGALPDSDFSTEIPADYEVMDN